MGGTKCLIKQSYRTFPVFSGKVDHLDTRGFGRILNKYEGYQMVPSSLKVLAEFGLCSNCSQKIVECSLARARKIFATARMLGISLKYPFVYRKHLALGNKS